jgi:Domain of Unknown Function (DUF1080)
MNNLKTNFFASVIFFTLLFVFSASNVFSQKAESQLKEPKVIQPVIKGKAPSDAIILFDKGSLENFESIKNNEPAGWNVRGRKFTVNPKTTSIQTKEKFGDCQLHVEWNSPIKDVKAGKTGQGCGNSGVYLMGKYEVQVLNSYINTTYYDGQAGAIYKQYPPLVNACLKPGKWQVYDIIFTAPRFEAGKQKTPGYFTVIHNGVLIQNHVEIKGATLAGNGKTAINETELPLMLQNHGNEVSYRNIWVRRL